MQKGRPWNNPEEIADLENLTQDEFLAKWPDRNTKSGRSYPSQMHRLGLEIKSHDAVVKQRRLLLGENDPLIEEEPDPEKLLTLIKEMQKETRKLITAKHEVNIKIDTTRPIGIVFTSDWHIGNEGTDYDQLEKDIELIHNNPYLYAYIGGDAVDNFILSKMIAATRSMIVQVPAQWYLFEHFLRKMQGSILAVAAGNHDGWTKALAGIDRVADIAKTLKLVYTGTGGLVNLTVGNETYRIFRRHKYRYWSSLNPLHSVKRLYDTGPMTWDAGITEHRHLGVGETFVRHGRNRIAIVTGTYKCLDGWALDNGFYDSRVCNPVIVFWPNTHKFELRMDLEAASKELLNIR